MWSRKPSFDCPTITASLWHGASISDDDDDYREEMAKIPKKYIRVSKEDYNHEVVCMEYRKRYTESNDESNDGAIGVQAHDKYFENVIVSPGRTPRDMVQRLPMIKQEDILEDDEFDGDQSLGLSPCSDMGKAQTLMMEAQHRVETLGDLGFSDDSDNDHIEDDQTADRSFGAEQTIRSSSQLKAHMQDAPGTFSRGKYEAKHNMQDASLDELLADVNDSSDDSFELSLLAGKDKPKSVQISNLQGKSGSSVSSSVAERARGALSGGAKKSFNIRDILDGKIDNVEEVKKMVSEAQAEVTMSTSRGTSVGNIFSGKNKSSTKLENMQSTSSDSISDAKLLMQQPKRRMKSPSHRKNFFNKGIYGGSGMTFGSVGSVTHDSMDPQLDSDEDSNDSNDSFSHSNLPDGMITIKEPISQSPVKTSPKKMTFGINILDAGSKNQNDQNGIPVIAPAHEDEGHSPTPPQGGPKTMKFGIDILGGGGTPSSSPGKAATNRDSNQERDPFAGPAIIRQEELDWTSDSDDFGYAGNTNRKAAKKSMPPARVSRAFGEKTQEEQRQEDQMAAAVREVEEEARRGAEADLGISPVLGTTSESNQFGDPLSVISPTQHNQTSSPNQRKSQTSSGSAHSSPVRDLIAGAGPISGGSGMKLQVPREDEDDDPFAALAALEASAAADMMGFHRKPSNAVGVGTATLIPPSGVKDKEESLSGATASKDKEDFPKTDARDNEDFAKTWPVSAEKKDEDDPTVNSRKGGMAVTMVNLESKKEPKQLVKQETNFDDWDSEEYESEEEEGEDLHPAAPSIPKLKLNDESVDLAAVHADLTNAHATRSDIASAVAANAEAGSGLHPSASGLHLSSVYSDSFFPETGSAVSSVNGSVVRDDWKDVERDGKDDKKDDPTSDLQDDASKDSKEASDCWKWGQKEKESENKEEVDADKKETAKSEKEPTEPENKPQEAQSKAEPKTDPPQPKTGGVVNPPLASAVVNPPLANAVVNPPLAKAANPTEAVNRTPNTPTNTNAMNMMMGFSDRGFQDRDDAFMNSIPLELTFEDDDRDYAGSMSGLGAIERIGAMGFSSAGLGGSRGARGSFVSVPKTGSSIPSMPSSSSAAATSDLAEISTVVLSREESKHISRDEPQSRESSKSKEDCSKGVSSSKEGSFSKEESNGASSSKKGSLSKEDLKGASSSKDGSSYSGDSHEISASFGSMTVTNDNLNQKSKPKGLDAIEEGSAGSPASTESKSGSPRLEKPPKDSPPEDTPKEGKPKDSPKGATAAAPASPKEDTSESSPKENTSRTSRMPFPSKKPGLMSPPGLVPSILTMGESRSESMLSTPTGSLKGSSPPGSLKGGGSPLGKFKKTVKDPSRGDRAKNSSPRDRQSSSPRDKKKKRSEKILNDLHTVSPKIAAIAVSQAAIPTSANLKDGNMHDDDDGDINDLRDLRDLRGAGKDPRLLSSSSSMSELRRIASGDSNMWQMQSDGLIEGNTALIEGNMSEKGSRMQSNRSPRSDKAGVIEVRQDGGFESGSETASSSQKASYSTSGRRSVKEKAKEKALNLATKTGRADSIPTITGKADSSPAAFRIRTQRKTAKSRDLKIDATTASSTLTKAAKGTDSKVDGVEKEKERKDTSNDSKKPPSDKKTDSKEAVSKAVFSLFGPSADDVQGSDHSTPRRDDIGEVTEAFTSNLLGGFRIVPDVKPKDEPSAKSSLVQKSCPSDNVRPNSSDSVKPSEDRILGMVYEDIRSEVSPVSSTPDDEEVPSDHQYHKVNISPHRHSLSNANTLAPEKKQSLSPDIIKVISMPTVKTTIGDSESERKFKEDMFKFSKDTTVVGYLDDQLPTIDEVSKEGSSRVVSASVSVKGGLSPMEGSPVDSKSPDDSDGNGAKQNRVMNCFVAEAELAAKKKEGAKKDVAEEKQEGHPGDEKPIREFPAEATLKIDGDNFKDDFNVDDSDSDSDLNTSGPLPSPPTMEFGGFVFRAQEDGDDEGESKDNLILSAVVPEGSDIPEHSDLDLGNTDRGGLSNADRDLPTDSPIDDAPFASRTTKLPIYAHKGADINFNFVEESDPTALEYVEKAQQENITPSLSKEHASASKENSSMRNVAKESASKEKPAQENQSGSNSPSKEKVIFKLKDAERILIESDTKKDVFPSWNKNDTFPSSEDAVHADDKVNIGGASFSFRSLGLFQKLDAGVTPTCGVTPPARDNLSDNAPLAKTPQNGSKIPPNTESTSDLAVKESSALKDSSTLKESAVKETKSAAPSNPDKMRESAAMNVSIGRGNSVSSGTNSGMLPPARAKNRWRGDISEPPLLPSLPFTGNIMDDSDLVDEWKRKSKNDGTTKDGKTSRQTASSCKSPSKRESKDKWREAGKQNKENAILDESITRSQDFCFVPPPPLPPKLEIEIPSDSAKKLLHSTPVFGAYTGETIDLKETKSKDSRSTTAGTSHTGGMSTTQASGYQQSVSSGVHDVYSPEGYSVADRYSSDPEARLSRGYGQRTDITPNKKLIYEPEPHDQVIVISTNCKESNKENFGGSHHYPRRKSSQFCRARDVQGATPGSPFYPPFLDSPESKSSKVSERFLDNEGFLDNVEDMDEDKSSYSRKTDGRSVRSRSVRSTSMRMVKNVELDIAPQQELRGNNPQATIKGGTVQHGDQYGSPTNAPYHQQNFVPPPRVAEGGQIAGQIAGQFGSPTFSIQSSGTYHTQNVPNYTLPPSAGPHYSYNYYYNGHPPHPPPLPAHPDYYGHPPQSNMGITTPHHAGITTPHRAGLTPDDTGLIGNSCMIRSHTSDHTSQKGINTVPSHTKNGNSSAIGNTSGRLGDQHSTMSFYRGHHDPTQYTNVSMHVHGDGSMPSLQPMREEETENQNGGFGSSTIRSKPALRPAYRNHALYRERSVDELLDRAFGTRFGSSDLSRGTPSYSISATLGPKATFGPSFGVRQSLLGEGFGSTLGGAYASTGAYGSTIDSTLGGAYASTGGYGGYNTTSKLIRQKSIDSIASLNRLRFEGIKSRFMNENSSGMLPTPVDSNTSCASLFRKRLHI